MCLATMAYVYSVCVYSRHHPRSTTATTGGRNSSFFLSSTASDDSCSGGLGTRLESLSYFLAKSCATVATLLPAFYQCETCKNKMASHLHSFIVSYFLPLYCTCVLASFPGSPRTQTNAGRGLGTRLHACMAIASFPGCAREEG